MEKDQYIRFDWAMKRMLRDKANFDVLEGLLSVLLKENVTILELLESEANQTTSYEKFNRVDIKAKNSKGEIVIIEIQNTRETYYLHRLLFGTSKAVIEHIKKGRNYNEIQKVISISILYFNLGSGKDYVYHGQTKFTGIHYHDELQITQKELNALPKKPENIFPEYYLIRVNEFDQVAKTPLEQWVRYLKTGEIHNDDTAPGLATARERLKYYNMTPEERIEYDRYEENVMIEQDQIETAKRDGQAEGREEGMAEGLEIGRAEGERNSKIKLAHDMKRDGMPIATIIKYSGMTEEEINKLKID